MPRLILSVLGLAVCLFNLNGLALAAPLPAWVEYGPHGPELRAVAPASSPCPTALVDGVVAMTKEGVAGDAEFPKLCRLALKAGQNVAIGDLRLRAPEAPRRIVIIGDTGCRLHGASVQPCNDPKGWPFPKIAKIAAAHAPDLVIHVGDYYYRETPCPITQPLCAGSPSGDHWPTWRADFFDPAAPLLQVAPFVFVRGNHEQCQRGGAGWSRLLEPTSPGTPCRDLSPSFFWSWPTLALATLDSSSAEDREVNTRVVEDLKTQLSAIVQAERASPNPQQPLFVLTHRPIWALVPVAQLGPFGSLDVAINRTLQAAVRGRLPQGTEMVISGHIHHFAAYDFAGARPAQLVAGEGGDTPEFADLPRFDRTTGNVDGLQPTRLSFARYGYVLMERQGEGWRIEARGLEDEVIAICTASERRLLCQTPRGAATKAGG